MSKINFDLAINGGTPVRTTPLPNVNDSSGHSFGDEEIDLILETLRSGKLNYTCGDRVSTLEREFAALFGVKFCTASSSGTAAIHIAVGAIGIEPGDEIIVPPITDIGTVIGILYQNAIPIFADVDPMTMTLDPKDVSRKVTEHTKAIIAVHLLGNACDMDGLLEVAEKHNLYVIEDAAQAYLTEYRGKKVGTIGSISCFSLQQSKHLTSGDGGLTITGNPELAERAKLFSDKGWKRPLYKDVMFLAPNYRLSELQAAVAIGQLRKLQFDVKCRRDMAHILTDILADVPGVIPPFVARDVFHSYWQYATMLDREVIKESVFTFGDALIAEGVPCLPGYTREPMYQYPIFVNQKFYGDSICPYRCKPFGRDVVYQKVICPNAERVLQDVIVIPWNSRYSVQDVMDIGLALKKVASHYAFSS